MFDKLENVEKRYEELNKNITEFKNTEFEFIFVNDGSSDNTLPTIKNLLKIDSRVKYISFSVTDLYISLNREGGS